MKGKPRRYVVGHNTRKSPVAFIVDPETGCWDWQRTKSPNGYGQKWNGERVVLAHRLYYELVIGPIPKHLEVDHLCRNRGCVNPGHLELVTRSENTRRGDGPRLAAARNRAKTHCPQGHPYDDENTYVYPDGRRACRACSRARINARNARKRASMLRAEATMSENI